MLLLCVVLLAPAPPPQMGDYLRSSVGYVFTLDRRGSPMGAPAGGDGGGWALRSSSELCGLGPDARLRYARQQLDFSASAPLDPTGAVSFTLAASAGGGLGVCLGPGGGSGRGGGEPH